MDEVEVIEHQEDAVEHAPRDRSGARKVADAEPAASEPAASEPAASEPMASEPATSEPAVTEPGEHVHGRARHAPGGSGALAAAGAIRPCPIPSGAVIFGELTSAFVDGARLLRFLGDRLHTGAVVDASSDRVQVSILHEGGVLALIAAGAEGSQRLDGLALPAPGSGDEHSLTVLAYRAEVAAALGQFVNLPERFERMHGSFVDFPALLAFLGREQASGGVRITTGSDTGVVLLRNGSVLGAYTRQRPELDDAEVVFELARAHDAEIDVHVGSLMVPPPAVSVSSILR